MDKDSELIGFVFLFSFKLSLVNSFAVVHDDLARVTSTQREGNLISLQEKREFG